MLLQIFNLVSQAQPFTPGKSWILCLSLKKKSAVVMFEFERKVITLI